MESFQSRFFRKWYSKNHHPLTPSYYRESRRKQWSLKSETRKRSTELNGSNERNRKTKKMLMPGTCNVTNTLACIIVLVTIIVETSRNEDFSQTASKQNYNKNHVTNGFTEVFFFFFCLQVTGICFHCRKLSSTK